MSEWSADQPKGHIFEVLQQQREKQEAIKDLPGLSADAQELRRQSLSAREGVKQNTGVRNDLGRNGPGKIPRSFKSSYPTRPDYNNLGSWIGKEAYDQERARKAPKRR